MKIETIEEQLKQYIFQTKGSQYAVLLTGSWGGGKTYFIKKFIDKALPDWRLNQLNLYDPIPSAYVSLNGKSTIEQVQIELLSKTDPSQFKVAKGAEFLIEGTLAQARIRRSVNLVKQLKFPANTVLLFDDLERWAGSLSEIMGFINRLVEHEKLKVIVIADEDVLNSAEQESTILLKNADTEILFKGESLNNFNKIKEKTIGKTFKFEQDFSALFKQFIKSASKDSCQDYLSSIQGDVYDIFEKSKINNLRILRRSIEDYQHFWNKLDLKKITLDDNFKRFTQQFFMFLFDFKKGEFTRKDLIEYNQFRFGKNRETEQKLDTLSEKYDESIRYDFYSATKTFWVSAILDSFIEDDLLHETMSSSGYYSDNSRPQWKDLWYYWKLPSSKFRLLIEDIMESLIEFKIRASGEVLHVFLTLSSLHNQKIISYDNALSKGRDYINNLFEQDILELWEFEARNFEDSSYHGLVYIDGNNDDSKSFIQYMEDKRKEKTLSKLKQESTKLLEQLRNEPLLFCERIKHSSENSDLYKTPVFSEINIVEFWDSIISLDPELQKPVFYSIKLRYEHFSSNLDELVKERNFLEGVKREFDNRLPNLDKLDQVRLTARVKETIEGSIEIFDAYELPIATPPPQA